MRAIVVVFYPPVRPGMTTMRHRGVGQHPAAQTFDRPSLRLLFWGGVKYRVRYVGSLPIMRILLAIHGLPIACRSHARSPCLAGQSQTRSQRFMGWFNRSPSHSLAGVPSLPIGMLQLALLEGRIRSYHASKTWRPGMRPGRPNRSSTSCTRRYRSQTLIASSLNAFSCRVPW